MRRPPVQPLLLLSLVALLVPASAGAEELQVELFSEPIAFTDVLDAFDERDPFDFGVNLDFERRIERGTIQREVVTSASARGRLEESVLEVARSERELNTLTLGLDIGLFKDLMLSAGIPLVLNDTRRLRLPEQARCEGCALEREAIDRALSAPLPADERWAGRSEVLFTPGDFESKARSGVPHVDLALSWGVFNQYRRPQGPTWVRRGQLRLPLGRVMRPCEKDAECQEGISPGTAALSAESRWSYRFRFIEPYVGLAAGLEWATAADEQFAPNGLDGYIRRDPPAWAGGTLGAALVPWEDRARFQRLAFDARFTARYYTSGRDYTPLFDVLGTSTSPYLTELNYDRVDDAAAATPAPFTGLTNTDVHARVGGTLMAVMRAARYVRFGLGVGFAYRSPHLITTSEACNTGSGASQDDPRRGNCGVGIINPHHRPVIDLPGGRFRLAGELSVTLHASATGQF